MVSAVDVVGLSAGGTEGLVVSGYWLFGGGSRELLLRMFGWTWLVTRA